VKSFRTFLQQDKNILRKYLEKSLTEKKIFGDKTFTSTCQLYICETGYCPNLKANDETPILF